MRKEKMSRRKFLAGSVPAAAVLGVYKPY